MKTTADIIGELARLLADFQGRQYSDPITAETLFFGDLGFASIDAVVLGEKLRELYGSSLPFNQFLAAAAQRKAQDIRVGELATFLADHIEAKP